MPRDQPQGPFAHILLELEQERREHEQREQEQREQRGQQSPQRSPRRSPQRRQQPTQCPAPTLQDEVTAVRRLCREFILGECESEQLTIIYQQAIALYQCEEERFQGSSSEQEVIPCEETERAIQVLARIKVLFKAFERRFRLGRLSQDDRQDEELRVWGLLQGVESLLGAYLLQRAAWTLWGPSVDRVSSMLEHVVDFNEVPYELDDEKFQSLFSHAYQHVLASIGSKRCVYEVLESAGVARHFETARAPDPVRSILQLPFRVFQRERPSREEMARDDPSLSPEELERMDDEALRPLQQYLQGGKRTEDAFRDRLFCLRAIALYAMIDAQASRDRRASVEELQKTVVEPFCRVNGFPTDNAAAVLALWRVDCPRDEYKQGLDVELLKPWVERRPNPSLYRKMLWSLARQAHWHKVCHLLESAPPSDFNVWDVVLRVGVLLETGQWQRAFFEQRHQFPRGGADGGVPGADRHDPLALWTLVDGMLQREQIHDLLSLPFSKEEEQDVISYLHESDEGHVLLLLLLRRRLIERAVAVHEMVRKDFPPDQVLTKDLARILRNYEVLLPEEEVRVLKGEQSSREETERTRMLVAHLERTARASRKAREQSTATPQPRRAPHETTGQRRQSWAATPPPPPFSSAPTPFTSSRDTGGMGLGMSRGDRAKARADLLRRSSPGLRGRAGRVDS